MLTPEQKRAFASKKALVQTRIDAMSNAIKKNNDLKSAIEAIDTEIAPLVMLKQDCERELAVCGDGISVTIGLVS